MMQSTRAENGADLTGSAISAKADFLLETVVSNVQWTALTIGAVSMALAAALRPDNKQPLHSCRRLLRDDGAPILLALKFGVEIGLSENAANSIRKLYANLASRKSSLASFADHSRDSELHRFALQKHWKEWRALASEALKTLDLLAAPTARRLPQVFMQDSERLTLFLQEAADGDVARINNHGVIAVLDLKQRRRGPRRKVSIEGRLILSDGLHAIRIGDVSQQGLGIVSQTPLAEGQTVCVALESGRRLEASVKRIDGLHIGLKLRQPLELTDPLLGG